MFHAEFRLSDDDDDEDFVIDAANFLFSCISL